VVVRPALARAVANSAELVVQPAESSAVAQLVAPVGECNAVAAPVVAELDAAAPVERKSAVAFELVAAVVFARAQRVAEEHLRRAESVPGGIAEPRLSVALAAQVSDLPAIAGRIDVPLARRCRGRHSCADGMAGQVFPADVNSRTCA
jgi:hypothetical protein